MGTLLRIEKDGEYKTKEFNSYYLAVVEKNRLLKKGIRSSIIDTAIEVKDEQTINRDKLLRTVYTQAEKNKIRNLTKNYCPEVFEKAKRGRPKLYWGGA